MATSLKTFCELTFYSLCSISTKFSLCESSCFPEAIVSHPNVSLSQDFTVLTVELIPVYQVCSELAINFFITKHLATYVAPEHCIFSEFIIYFLNT